MKELWKDIPNFVGYYQVSNFGRVKSLRRSAFRKDGVKRTVQESILMQCRDGGGYLQVSLCRNGGHKAGKVHLLVWDAFGDKPRDGIRLTVDHIDNNIANNRIDNLQVLTNRDNVIKSIKRRNKTSKFVGVYRNKLANKYMARIYYNGENKFLGLFEDEEQAHKSYQNKLLELNKEDI